MQDSETQRWGAAWCTVRCKSDMNSFRVGFCLGVVWGLIGAYQAEGKLGVAYTVIRPHSVLSATFVLTSAYAGDFCSFCFTRQGVFICSLWTNLVHVLDSWTQH